jgi:phage shock protein C
VNHRTLYRSDDDRVIAGVCGGVAEYFDVDPALVRVLWFLSFIFTGSITFWIYVVMAIVVPVDPGTWQASAPWAPGGAPIGPDPSAAPGGFAATPGTDTPPAGSAATGSAPAASAPASASAPWQAAPGGGWSGDWRDQRRRDRWARRQERHERRM